MIEHQMSRRTALKAGAVGAAGIGAVSLAACGASGGSNADTARNANDIVNGDTSANAGGSANAGAGATAGGTAGGGAGTHTGDKLTSLDAIKVGEAVSAKLADGSPVLVARPSSATAACFSAICTHMGCTVKPAGKELHCPCHGSVYDAVTGKVIHGPAPRALSPVSVAVVDGEVVTD